MTTPPRPFPVQIVLLLLVIAGAGCVTERSGSERESFASGMRRQPNPSQDAPAARAAERRAAASSEDPASARPRAAAEPRVDAVAPRSEPAQGRLDVVNTRVMLYQPKGDVLLILVNETNAGRATEAGRIDLALGDSARAYKVLSDAQMSALLRSLASQGYDANACEFTPEDAQYLASGAGDIPRFQGLVSVERGGAKTKVLGFRKSSEGDALGARRYQTYATLKGLVQKWFGHSSQSEFPVGGVTLPGGKAR